MAERRGRPATTDNMESFSLRIPENMRERVDIVAERNKWSRATAIRQLLELALATPQPLDYETFVPAGHTLVNGHPVPMVI